jgi:hypothetical protein
MRLVYLVVLPETGTFWTGSKDRPWVAQAEAAGEWPSAQAAMISARNAGISAPFRIEAWVL